MTRHKRKRNRSSRGSPGSTPKTTKKIHQKKGIPLEEEDSLDPLVVPLSPENMEHGDGIDRTPDWKRPRGNEPEIHYVPALPNIEEVKLPTGFGDIEFTENMTIIEMFKKLGNLVITGAQHNVDSLNAFKRDTYKIIDDGFTSCHKRISQIGDTNKENADKIEKKLTKHMNEFEQWKKDHKTDLSDIKSDVATAASAALSKATEGLSKANKAESSAKFVADTFDAIQPELEEFRYVEKMRLLELEEMKQELARMKNQQIANNRKSRELNLRIFNIPERREAYKNKAGKMMFKKEDTKEVLIDHVIHKNWLPDVNRSDISDLIPVVHRTGKYKDTGAR